MAEKHEAGAFDIRNVIGVLMGAGGVVFLLMGVSTDPETRPARKKRRQG